MAKRTLVATVILFVLALVTMGGCAGKIEARLPDNPLEFNTSEYANPSDEEDTYLSIEYKGRTYVPFGIVSGSFGSNDIGECLGYVVQDGEKLEDVRVCTLASDTDENYLVEIATEGFMDQPMVYRALDTAGKDIGTPSFVDSLDYDIWR